MKTTLFFGRVLVNFGGWTRVIGPDAGCQWSYTQQRTHEYWIPMISHTVLRFRVGGSKQFPENIHQLLGLLVPGKDRKSEISEAFWSHKEDVLKKMAISRHIFAAARSKTTVATVKKPSGWSSSNSEGCNSKTNETTSGVTIVIHFLNRDGPVFWATHQGSIQSTTLSCWSQQRDQCEKSWRGQAEHQATDWWSLNNLNHRINKFDGPKP